MVLVSDYLHDEVECGEAGEVELPVGDLGDLGDLLRGLQVDGPGRGGQGGGGGGGGGGGALQLGDGEGLQQLVCGDVVHGAGHLHTQSQPNTGC